LADEISPAAAAPARPSRLIWPGLIIALLAGHVVLTLVMVYIATRDRSFAIEPDYYQKALHWDAFVQQQRDNVRLGWTAAIDVDSHADVFGQQKLTCRLTDKAGRPLEGAAIDLLAFAHARGSQRIAAVLPSQGQGIYQAMLRFPQKGLWEFRLVVRRGPDTWTYTEQRSL
jgi:hypothetical protein